MFEDWDDEDLNLDEIFGQSQQEASQRDCDSRKRRDVENVHPSQSSVKPASTISPGRGPQLPKHSSSLTEQPANVEPASNSLFSDTPIAADRLSSKEITSLSHAHSRQTEDSSSDSPPFPIPLSRSDSRGQEPTGTGATTSRSPFVFSSSSKVSARVQKRKYLPPPDAPSRKRSESPPSSKKKRRKSRFPGPAGCLGADGGDDGDDNEKNETVPASVSTKPDSSSTSDSTPPDVDAECSLTLRRLVNSYAPLHQMAERLLTSLANLDWLSQDLVYGSSLPDERVPLLAVAVKAVQLGARLTVLRLHDSEGNEMNGFVYNARMQDVVAEKLAPGSSLLLKNVSAGYATRSLVSQYVLLTQKAIACACYVDSASGHVKLFVNPAVDVGEDDFLRLKSVFDKSVAVRSAGQTSQTQARQPSLFQSEFDRGRPPSSALSSSSSSSSSSFSSNAEPATARNRDLSSSSRPTPVNANAALQSSGNGSGGGRHGNDESTSQSTASPPNLVKRFNFTKSSGSATVPVAPIENINLDFGCDIDDETLSQMLDDDF